MTGTLVRVGRVTVAAVVLLSLPRLVHAQDSTNKAAASVYQNHLYDTFQASVDFTTVLNYSNARVDGSGGRGTNLDLRSTLGISGTSVQPALGIRWKPGRRTELDAGYQFINQSGTRSVSDSIVIGDNTLVGDLTLNTAVSSNNASLQFKYSIFAAERHNIGLAIGLGAIFFNLDLDGTASGSCTGPDCDTSGSGSFAISKGQPIPTGALGVFGQWRLGNRWYVGADVRGIGGRVDRYDVSIFEGDVAAQYFLSDRWGVGAGWYYTDVTVDVAPVSNPSVDDLSGKVSYNYSSLRLGIVAAF